mgnify:CR=1 FL=1
MLPDTVVLRMTVSPAVPLELIPPPSPPFAVLPVILELTMVSGPELRMAPPSPASALLAVKVESLITAEPEEEIAPPLCVAWLSMKVEPLTTSAPPARIAPPSKPT